MNSSFRITLSLLAAAISLPALAQGQKVATKETTLDKTEIQEVLDGMSKVVRNFAFVPGIDFKKWDKFVEDMRPELYKSKDQNEFVMKVNTALMKFGASHIALATPKGAVEMRTGKVVGIGFVPELVKDGILVVDTFPESPAEENGFEPGDIIIEADGKKPSHVMALRGEVDTSVTIKLKKKDGEIKTLTIKRREFKTKYPESITWATPEVGVIKIPSFMQYDTAQVEKVMSELVDKNAKTCVLDLRGNGGGYVWALQNLAGYFVKEEQPLGTFINRKSWDKFVAANPAAKITDLPEVAKNETTKVTVKSKRAFFSGQLIVLINGGTGSASEMMTAAAREILGAKVIGSQSAGAVLASTMFPLPKSYMLQYPFEDYVTIKGMRLEGNGVKPDYEAATPKSRFDVDPALQIALKLAKGEKP